MLKKMLGFVSTAPVVLGLVAGLAACSDKQPQQASADQVADKLDQAAAQSDPTAAAVIDKRADNLRGMGSSAPDPNAYAQETMRQAGAAASQSDAPAQ
jgi:hypothetical protein